MDKRNSPKSFRTLEIVAVVLAVALSVAVFFFWHPSAPGGQPVAADVKVDSPATYTEPITLKSEGKTFSISALGANPAQAVTVGAVTKYTDAFTNTDVTETKQSDRMKEDIILKQPGHPATFAYQIDVAPYDVVKDSEGSLVFYMKGHSGESSFWRFEIPAPFMIDASGKKSTVNDVESTLTIDGILTVIPSATWLASAAYPVDLDPTIIFFRAGTKATPTVPTIFRKNTPTIFRIPGIAPANTVAPAVTGTAQPGQTLSCSTGTWTGSPTPTYSYQWQHTTTNIGGATNSTYVLDSTYIGETIRCIVTGTNRISAVAANSNNSGSVAATVPGAPTIGTATQTGATTATVSFTAPASNGGATITTYTAYPSSGAGTGTLSQAGSGTITVTGLTANTSYTFTVKATNSVGQSAASSASNSITTAATVPDAPTIGTATQTGQTTATVSFTAPASNGGATITTYTVYGGGSGTLSQAGSGTINVTGLTAGTSYTFTVKATNSIGQSAASSASNSITTAAITVPGAPTIGTATWTGSAATVSFTAPANNGGATITMYKAYATPTGSGVSSSGTLYQAGSGTITVTWPTGTNDCHHSFTFTVTATNSVGESAPSAASNNIGTGSCG